MKQFDYTRDYTKLDLRKHPELYAIGKGEQGVLTVEPYKSELLPHWRFKNPEMAKKSSDTLFAMFLDYLAKDDFVGADMARKFLQMGYTRARRYANYKGGRKYIGPVPEDKKGQSGAHGRATNPRGPENPEKAKAAEIFKDKWQEARENTLYLQMKKEFIDTYG